MPRPARRECGIDETGGHWAKNESNFQLLERDCDPVVAKSRCLHLQATGCLAVSHRFEDPFHRKNCQLDGDLASQVALLQQRHPALRVQQKDPMALRSFVLLVASKLVKLKELLKKNSKSFEVFPNKTSQEYFFEQAGCKWQKSINIMTISMVPGPFFFFFQAELWCLPRGPQQPVA